MSDQEETFDESTMDDSGDQSETTDGTAEWTDTADSKNGKNQSNFKNLYKKTKMQETEIERLARENEELKKAVQNPLADASYEEKNDLKIFGLENPESKEHLSWLHVFAKEHNFDLETAWKYYKGTIPKESESYSDFPWKSRKKTSDIDYKSISLEDSANLTKEQRSEWRKANSFQ